MQKVDQDIITDVKAAMLEQSPKGGRLLIWATLLFLVFAYFWLSTADIDEITRGTGKVIPSQQLQVVQNLEGGIVAEILVQEGDVIQRDQPLLKIDDVRFSSSFKEGRLKYQNLKVRAARLEAEATETPFVVDPELLAASPDVVKRERDLYDTRKGQHHASKEILKQQISQRESELRELKSKRGHLLGSYQLAKRELDLTAPLIEDGAVSEVDILRLRRSVNDISAELTNARLSIPKVESRLKEAKRKFEETDLNFRKEVLGELAEVKAELSGLAESNVALEDRVERTVVRSPVHGRVNRLLVNTIGGIVQPGMDLVEIVPLDDSLLVEARIQPGDIGFLHPGQKAVVKFSAYDFAIYGGLDADLEYISADSLMDEQGNPYYLIRVRTRRNHLEGRGGNLDIIPGMLTDVDIKTGRKTVLEYLLKPVLRTKEYALRER